MAATKVQDFNRIITENGPEKVFETSRDRGSKQKLKSGEESVRDDFTEQTRQDVKK